MNCLGTIAKWITGGMLALALTLAPIVPAFANCPTAMTGMAKSAQMGMNKSEAMPSTPCDCKDCSTDAMKKKSCAGECVCAPLALAIAPLAPLARMGAARLEPQRFATLVPIARPPDTPPPKLFA